MPIYLIIIISAIAALSALALVLFALAAISYKIAFGSRADKNPLLKYFTADDFNLAAEPITVKSDKFELSGFVYTPPQAQNPEDIVIFAHGMGPGQIAYTTEIATLCKGGATVIALDSTGCNLSQGKSIKGMYEGVKTVLAAIGYAQNRFKNPQLILIGHSWGGYSVLCAAAEFSAATPKTAASSKTQAAQTQQIKKVIAISAPASPAKTLQNGAAQFIGKPLAVLLTPFWAVIDFFKFGKNGNANAAKAATKLSQTAQTRVLLIHGDADKTVSPANAVFYKTESGANLKKHLACGKAHNPYNTARAEQLLQKLLKALTSNAPTDEKQKFFKEFDFTAATEEDEEVMRLIKAFPQGEGGTEGDG